MSPSPFRPLPRALDDAGRPRRVGLELEFTALSERRAAAVLAQALGGQVEEEDPHAFHLVGSALGTLSVELDLRHVHPHRRAGHPAPWLRPPASTWLGAAAGMIVPRELVTEPIEPARFGEVDRAAGLLRAAGAQGAGVTAFGSLGLHFNVAPASLAPAAILATLQAYLVLEDWLRAQTLDSRALRFFAPPVFPAAYRGRVLAPDYRPDLPLLCEDYLAANPTRQRGLDLLPLFLDRLGGRIAGRIVDKVKPRAVLHYRLPVAYVGVPGWSAARDWNNWIEVERLAGDAERLVRLAARRREGSPVGAADE